MDDKRGKKRVQRSPGGRHVVGAKFNNAVLHAADRAAVRSPSTSASLARATIYVWRSPPTSSIFISAGGRASARANEQRENHRGGVTSTRGNKNELSSTVRRPCGARSIFLLDAFSIFHAIARFYFCLL